MSDEEYLDKMGRKAIKILAKTLLLAGVTVMAIVVIFKIFF